MTDAIQQILHDHQWEYDSDCDRYFGCSCDTPDVKTEVRGPWGTIASADFDKWTEHVAALIAAEVTP